jgi:hypothetical protein
LVIYKDYTEMHGQQNISDELIGTTEYLTL